MPHSQWVESYEDVRTVLDTALEQGGGTYTLPTRAQAVEWRKRAYVFRKHANTQWKEKKYNALSLSLPKDSLTITFKFNTPTGTFISPDGEEIEIVDREIEADVQKMLEEFNTDEVIE